MGLTVLRIKPTPTRFPISILYTPLGNTTLNSIPRVASIFINEFMQLTIYFLNAPNNVIQTIYMDWNVSRISSTFDLRLMATQSRAFHRFWNL